jgi:cytochrome c556
MRFVSFAAACASWSLTACGGWESGQANNAQGNISNDSRAPEAANSSAMIPSNTMVMLAVPLSNDRAIAVMKQRHDGMHAIADSAKAIHRGLAGTPDHPTVRSNAAKLVQLSNQASHWFPAGTGPDVGKTRAKPEIWQTAEDFAAKMRNFQAAARAFNVAARGSDTAATNARFDDLDGTCKACHDKYRAEEKR